MEIKIGQVVPMGKIHMHIDGQGCGAARRAKIAIAIKGWALGKLGKSQLCKRCFTAKRVESVSQRNAYAGLGLWSATLESFLMKLIPAQPATPPERLAEMVREIGADLRSRGVLVKAA